MNRSFLRSLSFKIVLAIVLVEAIALTVIGNYYSRSFSRQIDGETQRQIQTPGWLLAKGLLSYDSVTRQELMRELVGEELGNGFIFGADGNILYSLHPENIGQSVTRLTGLDLATLKAIPPAGEVRVHNVGGHTEIVSITPLKAVDGQAPLLFAYFQTGTAEAEKAKARITSQYFWGSIAALGATSITIILMLSSQVTRRIRTALSVIDRVEKGDLAARAPDTMDADEISDLNRGINTMTARLEDSVEALERRIAELQEAQAALVESEGNFRRVFEAAPLPLVLLRKSDLRVMMANRVALETLEVPPGKVAEARPADYYADPARGFKLQKLMRRKGLITDEALELKSQSGRRLWVQVSALAVQYRGEDALLIAMTDITGRKIAEDALRRENAFRQLIIESAAEGICVFQEIPDSPFLRFFVWNERMVEITGFTLDEINQRGWYLSVFPDPAARERARWRISLIHEGQNLQEVEWEITRSDGTRRQILLSTRVLPGESAAPAILAVMHDITERKTAIEALRHSEERYRLLVESAIVGIFVAQKGVIRYCNRSLTRILGSDEPSALVDLRLSEDLAAPEAQADLKAQLDAVICGEELPVRPDWQMLRRDGKRVWVQAGFTVIRWEDEPAVLGFVLETTALRHAEETKERLSDILQATTDFVGTTTVDGRLLYINRAGRALVGFERMQDIRVMGLQEVHPEWARETLIKQAIPIALREGVWTGESALVTRTGHEIPVSQVIISHYDSSGAAQFLSTIIRDISEQKRAEQALRESEAQTRLVIEQALDAVVSIDESGAITAWNLQAEVIFGWPRVQAIGQDFITTILPPQSRETYRHAIREFIATGKSDLLNRRFELTALRHDGAEFPVEISLSPLQRGGRVVFSAFLRDITERQRAEAEIRRFNHELEERVRKRTADLQLVASAMAGREVRMADLKQQIRSLREQLLATGRAPAADTADTNPTSN